MELYEKPQNQVYSVNAIMIKQCVHLIVVPTDMVKMKSSLYPIRNPQRETISDIEKNDL